MRNHTSSRGGLRGRMAVQRRLTICTSSWRWLIESNEGELVAYRSIKSVLLRQNPRSGDPKVVESFDDGVDKTESVTWSVPLVGRWRAL